MLICAAACCEVRALFPTQLGRAPVDYLLGSMFQGWKSLSGLAHAWLSDKDFHTKSDEELERKFGHLSTKLEIDDDLLRLSVGEGGSQSMN